MEPESRDPARDGRALREMAKLANAPAPKPASALPRKPNADHSGLVDLAALMAQEPNWLEGALARAKVSAGTSLGPPNFSPSSFAPTISELPDDGPNGLPRSRSLPLVIACAGAGLLVAAACVFAIRMGHRAPPVEAPVQAVAVAHVDAPVIPPPPPAAEPATAAAAPALAAAPATTAADNTPARAENDLAQTSPTGHHGHHGRHEARIAEAHVAAAAIASPVADAPAAAPARHGTPSAPHAGSALDAALRAAAGPAAAAPIADSAPAAAKAAPAPAADRPERPSGSAVTSALTEVLGNAKRCVAGMSDPSRALVTFGSEGKVARVDVTGPAGADAKATQCLRSAFGRARVPAFSQSTYAAGVTVRP